MLLCGSLPTRTAVSSLFLGALLALPATLAEDITAILAVGLCLLGLLFIATIASLNDPESLFVLFGICLEHCLLFLPRSSRRGVIAAVKVSKQEDQ